MSGYTLIFALFQFATPPASTVFLTNMIGELIRVQAQVRSPIIGRGLEAAYVTAVPILRTIEATDGVIHVISGFFDLESPVVTTQGPVLIAG